MARGRSERARSKTQALDDLTQQIEQLQAFIPKLEDLGREGFPYLEGALTRTELQLRECIKRAFGDKSPEFQTHRHLKLALSSPTEKKQTLTLIRDLIVSLEEKKLELQGLKPAIARDQAPSPPSPTLTLVPPACSNAQVPMPATTSMATGTTLNLTPGVEKPAVPTARITAAVPPPSTPPPAAVEFPPTLAPAPPMPSVPPRAPIEPISSLFRTQETKSVPPTAAQPAAVVPAPSTVAATTPAAALSSRRSEPPSAAALSGGVSESSPAARPSAAPEPEAAPEGFSSTQEVSDSARTIVRETPRRTASSTATAHPADDPLSITRQLCQRFHVVARQLRLRGEYRSTVTVEDECDVLDLMHALLRQHYDDIGTDEWAPSYANGVPRTSLLLDHDRLAIVVKKTRAGLSRKDLADQLRVDLERYRDRGRCAQMLCFIYDPEGRIGNPRGLESELSVTSEHFAVDVIVAPK
jgi:hypothetical protein